MHLSIGTAEHYRETIVLVKKILDVRRFLNIFSQYLIVSIEKYDTLAAIATLSWLKSVKYDILPYSYVFWDTA